MPALKKKKKMIKPCLYASKAVSKEQARLRILREWLCRHKRQRDCTLPRSDDNSICAYVHLYAQSLAPDLQYTNKTRLYPAVLHVFLHLDSNQNRFIPFQCQIQFCSLRSHYLQLQFSSIFYHYQPELREFPDATLLSITLQRPPESGLKASVYIHCLNQ